MAETVRFLALGGPIMGVIVLCSLVAMTIFIERVWALQRHRVVPPRLRSVVTELLRESKVDEARTVCTGSDSAFAAIALTAMKRVGASRSLLRELVQDRGRREASELERFTGALGAIATVTPLLGLLGTITGMIKTFQSVQGSVDAGQVAAGALATGIWEALITTAAGLTVAIPTFLAYRFLIARIDRLVGDLEEAGLELVDLTAGDDE